MFNVSLSLSDLRDKLNGIGNADLARTIAGAVANEAVQPELAKEPFRATRKKMIFVSAKQRAFVIAAIKRGDIEVPYRRTGAIGISEQHPTTSGVDVAVPVEYSDWVRTRGRQARYFDYWPDDVSIAEKIEGDTAELIGTAAVLETLEKAGLT